MAKLLWQRFENYRHAGIIIALAVITLWFLTLGLLLTRFTVDFTHPLTYIFIALMSHLYTGLFITAHDAMHGVVSKNKQWNTWLGRIAATLFAYNNYSKLFPKHHEHHRFAGTAKDPDYHHGSFFPWYIKFAREYVTIWQILLMSGTYELLKLFFAQPNVLWFYIVPSILSTFQLFYFGTYLPHKGEHDNRHRSRSQKKNHLAAFLSCYFFGYHYEHHHSPGTPWWKLYRVKERLEIS